ncbi:hypothetical protein PRIPAC_91690 [Pristionchus pacificus]|uniref:Zinc finger protein n=1 Tax=Pristionchus pacificus TaxID=54126 RepID=A0A2A6BAA7_PRIPA|nr:hypothetical protein PRIPAC_91690 [Pristionchus pacificus]|eukprot:PDM62781.1 zinc finger protein [Pristionchus pacificus]
MDYGALFFMPDQLLPIINCMDIGETRTMQAESQSINRQHPTINGDWLSEVRPRNKCARLFSRSCPTCLTEAPRRRVVFTRCGHAICRDCADTTAWEAWVFESQIRCPICEEKGEFVTLREEEEENGEISSIGFSRQCLICVADSPSHRDFFTECGHLICTECSSNLKKKIELFAALSVEVKEVCSNWMKRNTLSRVLSILHLFDSFSCTLPTMDHPAVDNNHHRSMQLLLLRSEKRRVHLVFMELVREHQRRIVDRRLQELRLQLQEENEAELRRVETAHQEEMENLEEEYRREREESESDEELRSEEESTPEFIAQRIVHEFNAISANVHREQAQVDESSEDWETDSEYSETVEEELEDSETRERIEQLRRENDQCADVVLRFTRSCRICLCDSPRQRAVFAQCGHIVCLACAEEMEANARVQRKGVECPFCRCEGPFVKLFEQEEEQ